MASEAQLISQKPVIPSRPTAPAAAPKAAPESVTGRHLNFSSMELRKVIGDARNLGNPHRVMDGVTTRPLAAQTAAAQVSVPKLEIKELGNLGAAPAVDPNDAALPYEQETGNLTALATLLTALRPDLGKQLNTLVRQAAQEEMLLNGKGVA